MNLEIELKLALDPDQVPKLLKSKRVQRAATGEAQRKALVSTYYDTRRHSLRRRGMTLRVRQIGERFEQTVKVPVAGPVGMQNCQEWTVPLPSAQPDPARLDSRIRDQLLPARQPVQLQPVFTTTVQRTLRILAFGGARFEMALDIGALRSHGDTPREQAVCEVEFELLAGDAAAMLDFALGLCEELELRPLFQSKAQRGYGLARPALQADRDKAQSVDLISALSVGEAFQQIVGEALRHLQGNYQLALAGQPGGIHQSRVAIRRIRAALRAFKQVLPWDKRKAFNGEFRWFQSRLAPARDWHVFLSETLPHVAAGLEGEAAAEEWQRLRRLALEQRREGTASARDVLCRRRFTRLLLHFQRWLMRLEAEQPALFQMALQPFASAVLAKTHRYCLADARPLSRMSEGQRHELRKRGKKLRYVAEFFAGLWQGPAVTDYVATLETLQDRLGEANDAVAARLLMASLPPRRVPDRDLLRVQDWSRARETDCVGAGQPVWRRMQRAAPFWEA